MASSRDRASRSLRHPEHSAVTVSPTHRRLGQQFQLLLARSRYITESAAELGAYVESAIRDAVAPGFVRG